MFSDPVYLHHKAHLIVRYAVADSTNLRLKADADQYPDGTVIMADEQTNGRGRMDRRWLSRSGAGAWFSYLFKPSFAFPAMNTPGFVFVAALAAANALILMTGADIQIKWPNDLVFNGKKLCGIMCEMKTRDTELDHAVIGIGINLSGSDFPDDLPYAASVESETGIKISPERMITAFLDEFDKVSHRFLKYGLKEILNSIAPISATLGKKVTAVSDSGIITGIATGFLDDGALLIDDGSDTHVFRAGDVSVRGVMGYT